ncbi:MAG: DUF2071 domain-containing protein, partial [Actinomycetota bacterium]|nr:DUF2071 domain-containing protein [Actinomycetota bacterium]
ALLGAALPAVAPAAAGGATGAFLAIEWTALALSGLGGNVVYGVVGLALVGTAGRRLHPLVRLVGLAAFATAIVSGVGLVAVPHWFGPIVGVSIGFFVAFAVGFGWQLAASRRAQPAAEATVRRAVRALVPLHPISFTAQLRHLVAVELACDPSRVAPLLPPGLVPSRRDGRARIILLGAVTQRARIAGLPRPLGMAATPTVVLQAEAVDHSGERVATYLRGWADGTFGAAAMHWLTELQLSRVDLQVRATERQWMARGSAGSVRLKLETDPTATGVDGAFPAVADVAPGVALVARGGRLAEVPIRISGAQSRPARVTALGVPFLDRLDAHVVGAAFLGDPVVATGRARWR